MFIKHMSTRNFRVLPNSTIHFNEKLNVFAGNNAEGKTAILEAAYLSYRRNAISPEFQNKFAITDTDFCWNAPKQSSVHITTMFQKRNETHLLTELTREENDPNTNSNIVKIGGDEEPKNEFDDSVFVYCNMSNPRDHNKQFMVPGRPFLTFFYNASVSEDCTMKRWVPILAECFDQIFKDHLHCNGLHFVLPEDGGTRAIMAVKNKDGYRIPITSFNGNIQAMVDVLCHLVFSAMAFDKPIAEMDGVVFINDIEMGLGIGIQQTILMNLMALFPNIQFIVSTKSPFIIGSVDKSHVFTLGYSGEDKEMTWTATEQQTLGIEPDSLTACIFHRDPMPPVPIRKTLSRCLALIQQGLSNDPEMPRLIEEVKAVYGDQHYLFLEIARMQRLEEFKLKVAQRRAQAEKDKENESTTNSETTDRTL